MSLELDANAILKKNIDKLTNVVGTQGVCIPIAAAYHSLVEVVGAVASPVAHFKEEIIAAMDNNEVIDNLSKASQAMNVINNGLGQVNLQISQETIQAMNIFNKVCLDYNEILPNAMKRFLNSGIDFVNDAQGMWDFPDEVVDMMEYAQGALKEKALSMGFDEGVKLVLTPLTMYRNYIKSTGVVEMLKRLRKFEKCMMNTQTCNRPKQEFYFPGTRKYNSQYYIDLLCIDLKGEILLTKMSQQLKVFEGNSIKVLKKIDAFKEMPVKNKIPLKKSIS